MSTAIVKRNMSSIYIREAWYEFLSVLRTPGFSIPTFAFPLIFYTFFGILFGQSEGGRQATYLVATYGTFAVMGPALFGFGAGLAAEKDRGWLLLKQVSPMPTMAYFCAKLAMAMLFATSVVLALFLLASFAGNVNLEGEQWFRLGFILIVGTVPFCALGLLIGCWANARSAIGIVNLVYLPMSMLSGLWMPIMIFPEIMQKLANLLPSYHLAQLALKVVAMDQGGNSLVHMGILLGQALVFLWFAKKAFFRTVR